MDQAREWACLCRTDRKRKRVWGICQPRRRNSGEGNTLSKRCGYPVRILSYACFIHINAKLRGEVIDFYILFFIAASRYNVLTYDIMKSLINIDVLKDKDITCFF